MEDFSGFIDNIEDFNDKYSYYFDKEKLILNRIEKHNVTSNMSNKNIDFLSTRLPENGSAIFYNSYLYYPSFLSSNQIIIRPSYLCLSKYANIPIAQYTGLVFKSKFIDILFPPTQIIEFDSLSSDNIKNIIRRDGSKVIKLKKWEDVDKSFNLSLNGEKISIMFNITSPGTINEKDNNLGEISSNFTLKFEHPQNIEKLKDIYLIVRKFFQFLSNFQDISFDSITVLGQIDNNYKYQDIGFFYDLKSNFDNNYNYKYLCPVSYYFNNIENLFLTISNEKINFNYIPKNNNQLYSITPEQYVNCCGAFEYNYKKVFGEPQIHPLYENILIDFNELFINNDKYNSKQKSFCKKILGQLKREAKSVEQSYGNCLERYNSILKNFLNKISAIYALTPKRLGKYFSSRRNLDAHGEMESFSKESLCAYFVAEVIINCLILEKSGYDFNEIQSIIEKKFVYNSNN